MLTSHLLAQSRLIFFAALKRLQLLLMPHQLPPEQHQLMIKSQGDLLQHFRSFHSIQCHLGLWARQEAYLLTPIFTLKGVHFLRRKPASSRASHLTKFVVNFQPLLCAPPD